MQNTVSCPETNVYNSEKNSAINKRGKILIFKYKNIFTIQKIFKHVDYSGPLVKLPISLFLTQHKHLNNIQLEHLLPNQNV